MGNESAIVRFFARMEKLKQRRGFPSDRVFPSEQELLEFHAELQAFMDVMDANMSRLAGYEARAKKGMDP